MGKTAYDVYRYSDIVVLVFGIIGNTLVVVSMLTQTMKSNYYFLVLQLAICDLGVLIIYISDHINLHMMHEQFLDSSTKGYCFGIYVSLFFQVAGLGMMLIISVLRYRAIVHPWKPAISRRKLKVVCALVYIVAFIAGYGTFLPVCFMNDAAIVYTKFYFGYFVFCFYFFPPIFMAVVYYKIGRALIEQNKHMKSICSSPVRRSAPSSSFNILKFIRNRRTVLVCICTALCYGVGNIPFSVWLMCYVVAGEYHLLMKYVWVDYLAGVLRVASSHSVNPLIYGILDKKLFTFWKYCRKEKQKTRETLTDPVESV